MLDIASKVVALFVAVISAVTTIFNVFFKGERKRKEAYYNKLVKPFAIAYKRDPNINTIDFVNRRVELDDDDIPKYVFLLLDLPETEDDESIRREGSSGHASNNDLHPNNHALRKVLIDDYFTLYPNEYSRKRNIFEAIQKMLDYLMFLLTFLFTVSGAFVLASGVMMLFSYLLSETHLPGDLRKGVIYTFCGVAISFAGLIPIKISEWKCNDMYTVKKKQIQKTIDEKVKRFDRRFNHYVI